MSTFHYTSFEVQLITHVCFSYGLDTTWKLATLNATARYRVAEDRDAIFTHISINIIFFKIKINVEYLTHNRGRQTDQWRNDICEFFKIDDFEG